MVAGSAVGLSAFGGNVTAKQSSSTPNPVVVLGDETTPLTRGDVTSAVKRYKNEYRRVTDKKPPKGFALPEFDGESDRFVSGYVYYIGSDGLPMTHVSYGYPTEKSSSDVSTQSTTESTPGHDRAKEQAQQFESAGAVNAYSSSPGRSGDVGTAADQSVTAGEGWNSHGVVTGSGEASNWGEATIQGELFQNTRDQFGIFFRVTDALDTVNGIGLLIIPVYFKKFVHRNPGSLLVRQFCAAYVEDTQSVC